MAKNIFFLKYQLPVRRNILMLLCLSSTFTAVAQLSPPGLDGAKTVAWTAMGFSQQLGKKWTVTIYAGGSGQSALNNYSALKKPAIFVLNQETLYQFNSRWSLAVATSLRYQELYESKPPYQAQNPPWRKEIRYYARLFYRMQTGRVAWAFSFRPELRTYYTVDGKTWNPPAEQRYRLKGQANIPLNAKKNNILVLANEWLFASEERYAGHWSSLQFTEDRLSTYIRHAFKKPNAFLDLGLMHQLWKDERSKLHYTTYFAADLIFQNPFGH